MEDVSKAIVSITEESITVNRLIEGLRSSSAQQAVGAGQISIAVTQVEKVDQNAAANSEQTASAGEELNSQAAALQDLVTRLEQLVGVVD